MPLTMQLGLKALRRIALGGRTSVRGSKGHLKIPHAASTVTSVERSILAAPRATSPAPAWSVVFPGDSSRASRSFRAFSSSAALPEASYNSDDIMENMDRSLVFVHNGICGPFPYESTQDFLLMGKRGAYTTARSVDTTAVFEFEAHVERLVKTATLMLESDEDDASDAGLAKFREGLSYDVLRPLVEESMAAGMCRFREANPGQEMKVTLLMTWEPTSEGGKRDIYTLVVPLGDRPTQPVKVQVNGKPRKNAMAKDSEWTRQRRALELQKPEDCNEVVLCDDSGLLFEGLQTNFYAVKGGRLQTAGEGVLEGTVRKLLLEECEREGVEVDLSPPSLEEIDEWQGCFISSTSRLLLPVSRVVYTSKDGEQRVRSFEPLDPLVTGLEGMILERYRQESTRVVEEEGTEEARA